MSVCYNKYERKIGLAAVIVIHQEYLETLNIIYILSLFILFYFHIKVPSSLFALRLIVSNVLHVLLSFFRNYYWEMLLNT